MAQLFDVAGVFANILQSPEQQRAAALQKNMGMFGAGLGGSLANSITNLELGGRAGLNKALQAVNPSLDIRTNQQKLTEAINSINPEDPDAEAKYLEATRQYAPERLGEVQGQLRQLGMENAAESRREAEEERRESQEARQVTRAAQLTEAHNSQMQREALRSSIANMDFNDAIQAREGVQAQKEYILSSTYGAGMASELEAMTPEQVRARFDRIQEIEGGHAESLRGAVKDMLGEDSEIVEHLDALGQQQLMSIMGSITQGVINPRTQVIGGAEKGYNMVIANPRDPSNPTTVPLVAGVPDPERPVNPRSLNNRVLDIFKEGKNRVDLKLWGEGSVTSPSGQVMNPNDLVQQTATNYYQKSNMTEAEFEQRVRDAVAAINSMEGDVTFERMKETLEGYFPKGSVNAVNDALAELGLE